MWHVRTNAVRLDESQRALDRERVREEHRNLLLRARGRLAAADSLQDICNEDHIDLSR